VLFVGGSGALIGLWALSDRETAFWPGWVVLLWGVAVTLRVWAALRPADRWRRGDLRSGSIGGDDASPTHAAE
jgi:hypothetical protein